MPTSRHLILDAAEALVRDSSVSRVTLDAVAAKAQVSKGGLLYHFRSKEALLRGMIDRQLQRFEDEISQLAERAKGEPGAEFRAYMGAATQDSTDNKRLCAALLAAAANEPGLLDPVREHHRRNLEMIERCPAPFDQALVLWLAAAGLRLLEMLQVSPLTARQRNEAARALVEAASFPKPKKGQKAR